MALGMDMLVGTLIKAVGLDKDEVINKGKEFGLMVVSQIQNFDARLRAMEEQNAALVAQNAIFVEALKAQGLAETLMKECAEKSALQIEAQPEKD